METYLELKSLTDKITGELNSVILGKPHEIRLIIAAALAQGHVLLDDVPGTGKTTLAKAIARCFDCDFKRVQFTPDLLPSELTGLYFYHPNEGAFTFKKGALFTNILLADEINRATPRTQSGLLESMEESQITVDGNTFALPLPYFVIATQNPVETQGTFPLPEAQLDRFLIRLSLGYPSSEQAAELICGGGAGSTLAALTPICSGQDWLDMARLASTIFIHPVVASYIVSIAEATRSRDEVALGVSTRGCLALSRLAKALVAMDGRKFVTPDDVRLAAPYVLTHRVILKSGRGSARAVVEAAINSTETPVEDWKK